MNRLELIQLFAVRTGLSQKQAKRLINAYEEVLIDSLSDGHKIHTGIGTFQTKARPAHQALNPATGESVDVPARIRPAFRFNRAVKQAVNGAARFGESLPETEFEVG